jgi:hypothetical protein
MRLPVARWQLNFSENSVLAPERNGFPVTKSNENDLLKRTYFPLKNCWFSSPASIPCVQLSDSTQQSDNKFVWQGIFFFVCSDY